MNLTEYVISFHEQEAAAAAASSSTSSTAESASYSAPVLSDSLLKNITLQISSALMHIHSRGLVHLDIKPDNILVGFDGVLRVADFGQARVYAQTQQLLTNKDCTESALSPLGVVYTPSATLAAFDWDTDLDGIEGDSVFMAP